MGAVNLKVYVIFSEDKSQPRLVGDTGLRYLVHMKRKVTIRSLSREMLMSDCRGRESWPCYRLTTIIIPKST